VKRHPKVAPFYSRGTSRTTPTHKTGESAAVRRRIARPTRELGAAPRTGARGAAHPRTPLITPAAAAGRRLPRRCLVTYLAEAAGSLPRPAEEAPRRRHRRCRQAPGARRIPLPAAPSVGRAAQPHREAPASSASKPSARKKKRPAAPTSPRPPPSRPPAGAARLAGAQARVTPSSPPPPAFTAPKGPPQSARVSRLLGRRRPPPLLHLVVGALDPVVLVDGDRALRFLGLLGLALVEAQLLRQLGERKVAFGGGRG
jgi:hypothetical protein